MDVEVSGLTKRYHGAPVFENASFTVRRGETAAVVGVNGSGKTTLLQCLAGVVAPDRGKIRYDGEIFTRTRLDLRRRFFFIPEFTFVYEPPLPQEDFVAEPEEKEETTGREMVKAPGAEEEIKTTPIHRMVRTVSVRTALREELHLEDKWRHRGLMESVFLQVLTKREKTVVGFLTRGELGLTLRWRILWFLWFVGLVIVGPLGKILPLWLVFVPLIALPPIFFGISLFLNKYTVLRSGGLLYPVFGLYPFTMGEVGRITLKLGFLQLFTAFPFIAILAAVLFHVQGWREFTATGTALRICTLLFALFPLTVSCTLIARAARWRLWLLFLPLVLLVLVTSIVILLIAERLSEAAAAAGVIAALSWAIYFLDLWRYARNAYDLRYPPPRHLS